MSLKLALLVLAHKNSKQTEELIQVLLKHEQVQVFVHVDLKSSELFQDLTQKFQSEPRLNLIEERYSVDWGSYRQITATMALLKASVVSKADYYCLISAQDFPIKPLSQLIDFFEENKGKQFLVNFKLPDAQWEFGGLKRLEWFHVPGEKRHRLIGRLNGLIHRVQKVLKYDRKIEGEFYGGTNWFNVSSEAVQWVLEYIEKHPNYLMQFRWTRCADEIFMQTLLMRSPFVKQIISNDLRCVDWSRGPEFPRTFRAEDFELLVNQKEKFFARKFDSEIDDKIITLISERLKK